MTLRRRPSRLRPWLLLAAPLIGLGALACGESRPPEAAPPSASAWRRTCDGWEKFDWLAARQRPCAAPLHPLCLAAIETLLAAMALVARAPIKPVASTDCGRRLRRDAARRTRLAGPTCYNNPSIAAGQQTNASDLGGITSSPALTASQFL